MACADTAIGRLSEHPNSPAMNRSLSTPDLIAALTRLSKGPITRTVLREEENYVTTLDNDLLLSQRHSSLHSSGENEVSLSLEHGNQLTVPNGVVPHPSDSQIQTSNGSLVSFAAVQVRTEEEMLEAGRRISLNSVQSDSKRNLLSLQTVGRTLQQTHNHLKRTRLLHLFYFMALPIYTLIGAFIFQALDGEYDDKMLEAFKLRCIQDRDAKLTMMQEICNASGSNCFQRFKEMLASVDSCYREWQANNHTMITYPMSDFTNAIIYSFR